MDVVVAADTRDKRQRFTPQELETVYMGGLSDDELTQVETLAKNVFNVPEVKADPSARAITLRAPASSLIRLQRHHARPAGRPQPGAARRAPDSGGAHQHPQHRCPVAADHDGIQRVRRRAVDPERESESRAADYLLGTGFAQRPAGDSCHSDRLRPGFELAALERICFVWRRAYGVGDGAGHGHIQPQPEHFGLARAGPDSASPGGRRGGRTQAWREVSHPDLFLLEPVGQRREYSGIDGRRNLQQPSVRCCPR